MAITYANIATLAVGDNITAALLDQIAINLNNSTFTTPSLANSWVASGGSSGAPKYCLQNGIVYVTGAMKSGTANTTVFTFPAGMRPLAQVNRSVASAGGSAVIIITAAGALQVTNYVSPGSNAGVNLDFSFIAEQ